MVTKADKIFVENIQNIMSNGIMSENARPVYSNGQTANSKYLTQIMNSYDISKDEFPITTLRRIPIKSAIKELLWIYQDQTNNLSILKEKYGVNYWDEWDIGNGTIGARYGETVRKHKIIDNLLEGLEKNPWNRRNIINLWQYDDFSDELGGTDDGLKPCAFMNMFEVRRVDGEIYLDSTLIQRSNDMLVAHHINAMQYVALQMMIACHFGWKVGKFAYLINNLHIYDNQYSQANTLLERYDGIKYTTNEEKPKLVLKCKPKTNFYEIKSDDFELINYNPIQPQLKFDLAI